MQDYLQFAEEIARKAGDFTLRYFGSKIDIETKSDESPVTIADKGAEELLREEIGRRFPDDAIFGEEFGEKTGTSGYKWILDPIDGTKSFIRGVPLYGTMIAVEHEGRSKVGVIRFPPNGLTLSAREGGGCHVNGERCRVSETPDLAKASACTTDTFHYSQFFGDDALMRLVKQTALQRTWGDCYGYLLVATGKIDIMIDPIVHSWDIASLIPIIQEAGGVITDRTGVCGVEMTNTIACNKTLHPAVLKMINGK